ncbi:hypothetical protein BDQ17DRAFT_313266 [Cyathus striatus]|nr:hypothetical protein BDQ17DRAFT_313266 [Cyathus striatus]
MLKELYITSKVHHGPEQPTCQWKDIISLFSLNVTSAKFYSIPTHSLDIYSVPLHTGWRQLTELDLYLDQGFMVNPNLVDFASAIICHCQLLKMLKLGISVYGRYDNSAPQSEEDIILHHLTTLSLAVPASIGVLSFSKRLYLPSIKELNIQLNRGYHGDVFEISKEIIRSLLHIHEGCHSLAPHTLDWLKSTDNLNPCHILNI